MGMHFAPWVGTGLLALAILLVLGITVAMLPLTARSVTMRGYCPWARREVGVQYLTEDAREPIGVLSCTGLGDPRASNCGMPCVNGGVPAGAPPEAERLSDLLGS